MPQTVTIRGQVFDMVEKPIFAELMWIENAVGKGADTFTFTENTLGMIAVSVRRVDPKLYTWQQLLNMGADDVQLSDTEPDAEPEAELVPDPTAAVTVTAPPSSFEQTAENSPTS